MSTTSDPGTAGAERSPVSSMAAETAYGLAIQGARALSPVVAGLGGRSKLARGLRGRRGAAGRLSAWGRARSGGALSELPPGAPLAWFHAPSVGEGLQARAVLEALVERRPEIATAFTHFSPSAEALAEAMPADVADYLPWDVSAEVGPVLDALRPGLLAFTKTEVWPRLAREAERRGVPSVLVAATLPPGSSRLRWPARSVLRPAFGRLAAVLAISEDDAQRFRERMRVPADRVAVTGDPGIDSAAARAGAADPDAAYLRPFVAGASGADGAGSAGGGGVAVDDGGADEGAGDSGRRRPIVVAGSTWPADEEVLLEACTRVRDGGAAAPLAETAPGTPLGAGPPLLPPSALRLIVAPHEPTPEHLDPLEEGLRVRGWRTARLADVEAAGTVEGIDAVVVDRVGVLAHLYTVADVAYVGGGFHEHGLHSVLEPAAAGVPSVFGPRHENARAAADLVAVGGGRVAADAVALADVLRAWLSDRGARRGSGEAASEYIQKHRGAAGRTADRLLDILDRRPARPPATTPETRRER